MGQVALGLRSLVFRIVIFVIMAGLLAWILGGTLWPKPVSVVQPGVVTLSGQQFGWLVLVDRRSDQVRFSLVRSTPDGWDHVTGGGPFAAATPMSTFKDANGAPQARALVWPSKGKIEQLTVSPDGTVALEPISWSIFGSAN